MKKKSSTAKENGQITIYDLLYQIRTEADECSVQGDSTKTVLGKGETKQKTLIKQAAGKENIWEEDAWKEDAWEKEVWEAEPAKKESEEDSVCMDLPMDWENIFEQDIRSHGVHFDYIPDALIHCLITLGRVDIEFISAITGAEYKAVIHALQGSIYQNPMTWNGCFYKGWETADEYLSGNLKRKWREAEEAEEEYHGCFRENLKAIEQVMPSTVTSKDIYVTLGSPWVPTDIIDDFILHLLGDPLKHYHNVRKKELIMCGYKTKHDELTGTWEIPEKTRYRHSVSVSETWGTGRMEALRILEHTLNIKTVVITDEVSCPENASGVKRVINKEETMAAVEKQQKMIRSFQDWIWKDPERKKRLEEIFEEQYGCVRRRIFDGSFLEFPTMSPQISLFPYQKNAVARILFTPNTLLAHDVGSGKTYVMIAAGQELRRMGLSEKNMYVVPNNIVGQWEKIFLSMYPDARLLCVEPKVFRRDSREAVLKQIREEDFDGIIIAYSCFERIPLSKSFYREEMAEKKKQLEKISFQKRKATAALMRKKEKLTKELAELSLDQEQDEGIYFDELGITRLFVDEAHNFKNVPLETKVNMALGIHTGGSKKCQDMMDKVHMIQKRNGGRGVVMATGTPITNSITDAYIMQQYLQSGELAMMEMQSFDSWIGMFAERRTEFEIDVDTSTYRLATRFSKFHNLTELTSMLSMIADFHQVDIRDGVPEHDGYQDSLIQKTPEFTDYLKEISRRADEVRQGVVRRKKDNMLKITTDGRKAALDMRLVHPESAGSDTSKVARCAEQVAEIYEKTAADRSVQLIFCDSSTPKAGFNIYDELKHRLIKDHGISEAQIAFIHDAATETKRSALFRKVREGEIRILIGSTFKLGLGVNVQDRLIALHHIDVPWRPADMVQREGRILRQGNRNPKVTLYRYITEGSFDAYSWQLLETKQRFIAELLSGSLVERVGTDIQDTVLDYAEVKALAVGNPLVKERVETQNTLSRYLSLQQKMTESRFRIEKELLELPARIKNQTEEIRRCIRDAEDYQEWKKAHPPAVSRQEQEQEAAQRAQLREDLYRAVQDNILRERERVFMVYKGFEIILPARMNEMKPYVWLCREGRYHVELGDSRIGNLVRVDHYLEGLEEQGKRLKSGLYSLQDREKALTEELNREENYTEKIAQLRRKVAQLDQELGVTKE